MNHSIFNRLSRTRRAPGVPIRAILAFLLAAGSVFAASGTAYSADTDASIRLRPHCEDETQCREFVLYDTETMITDGLEKGDSLDLDVVLTNPSEQSIQSVQSWLDYDPSVLRGVDIRINDALPLVAPGEQAFDETQGIAKIGASNVGGGVRDNEIVVARVRFGVISPGAESRLKFSEFSLLGNEGKTKALVVERGRTVNVLKTRPRDLILYFGDDPPPSLLNGGRKESPSGISDRTPPGETTDLPSGAPVDNFAGLQPSGLRLTTNNGDVYALWEPMMDGRVRGYNVYYGTVSGKYIHRRTVSAASQDGVVGAAIRDLPIGQRYFFAVTAFDALQNETEFSYEAAVTVADSGSSTAPFVANSGAGASVAGSLIADQSRISGDTGLPAYALLAAALASGYGAYFLFRRKKA